MTVVAIRRIERAANKTAAARAQLQQSILDAKAAGCSLRDIAQAADLSHEWVRKIVAGEVTLR